MDQDSNAGLEDFLEDLESENGLWTTYSASLGSALKRADFWALAAIVAVERSAKLGGTTLPEITFRHGREDCSTSPDDEEEWDFPDGAMEHDHMFEYMEEHFGYNANQV